MAVVSTFDCVSIEEGLDLILSLLEPDNDGTYFPRRISTKMTDGRQIMVNNKEEALSEYRKSGLLDCEISAYRYPIPTVRGINTQPVNFTKIDVDGKSFKTNKALEQCLQDVLNNCRNKLGTSPTVLWSGGGYHPLLSFDTKSKDGDDIVLELESIFREFHSPLQAVSQKFMKYVEKLMTDNRADSNHNPSLGSCLVRIPGSFNSKYKDKDGNLLPKSKVCIARLGDGNRPSITRLLEGFWGYLIQERNNEQMIRLYNEQRRIRRGIRFPDTLQRPQYLQNEMDWVKRLLDTPLHDYRECCTRFIVVPYLMNVKNLSDSEILDKTMAWLKKCEMVCRLNFGESEVKYKIKYIRKMRYDGKVVRPSLTKLQSRNPELYMILRNQRVIY